MHFVDRRLGERRRRRRKLNPDVPLALACSLGGRRRAIPASDLEYRALGIRCQAIDQVSAFAYEIGCGVVALSVRGAHAAAPDDE